MARLILKSPYLKPAARGHAANYVRYIATREGVEKFDDPRRLLPAAIHQQKAVAQLLNDYPDLAELHEYLDFQASPSRENADEFMRRAVDVHGELLGSRENYVGYIATRPGAVSVQDSGNRGHGLFSDAGAPLSLSAVMKEVAEHRGNVWTHVISLRREDAARLGYDNADAWVDLLRRQRNNIARQMRIKPEIFGGAPRFTTKSTTRTCT